MAFETDKDILLDNIQYLLKERGIKLGDFEKDTGVYPGYISRMAKESTARPSFDFIVNAADVLNVTIDSLLRHRFSGTTPTEKYIENFLNKLIHDTENDALSWNVEDSMLLSIVDKDEYGVPEHDLFSVHRVAKEGENGETDFEEEVLFVSKAFGYQTNINGNGYSIRLKNKSTFYLMDVTRFRRQQNETPPTALEAWFYIPREGKSFLYNTVKEDYLAGLLRDLHSAIEESLKHPKVDSSVKNIIEAYMNDDFSDDTEKYDSDDIPF